MLNYANDLQYLFESSDTNRPYVVDTFLFGLSTPSGFNNNIPLTTFFKNITSVNIKSQNPTDVENYIKNANCPGANNTTQPCNIPITTNTFTDASMNNDVFLEINNSSTNFSSADFTTIITDVATSSTVSDNTAKDHILFRKFLMDNMEDIVRFRFKDLTNKLGVMAGQWAATDSYQVLYDPIMRMYNMKSSQQTILMGLLRDACLDAFKKHLDTVTAVNSQDILVFKDGAFNNRLYYNIRNRMINSLNVKSVYLSTNDDDVRYYKKLVVDMFLKSSYPMVHMIYMQAVMEKYATSGDYTNVRVIILSMVFYVFYFLKYLYNLSTNVPKGSTASYNILPSNDTALNTVFTKIKQYIQNNNKLDLNSNATSANDELKSIIVSLHTLSQDVTGQNKSIQMTSEQIKENQVTMRNIIFNIEVKRKDFKKASAEYVFALTLVILLVLINCVLLLVGLADYVFYLSGFFGVVVVLYLIISIIIRVVKGSMFT